MAGASPRPPAEEASRRHFDRFARRYERSRLLGALQRRALAEVAPRPDDRFLDVACGPGALVRQVAPRVERAVGIDLSEAMVSRGRELAEREGLSDRVVLLQGSSSELPFADGEFTAVVCTTALHHFPDPADSIADMARVLAPGGRLVIGDLARDLPPGKVADAVAARLEAGHVRMRTRRELAEMMSAAGLEVRTSRLVWGGVWLLVAAAKP